ncbi:helix-turn-helix domain-containing protein [Virgibacillus halodenitrificans]|nr:helix-turn-helix domain-containing protein [Virgibacillus halodenitrificans]
MESLHHINIQKMLEIERHKRFMTYEDVAKGLGCSASYVFRIEKGKRKKPSFEFVSKMINFFGVDNLSIYMDSPESKKSIQRENRKLRLLKFIETMDSNSVTQVQYLLEMVNEYQR